MKTFSDLVRMNYDSIVQNFKSGLKRQGYVYDEDVMNDAFISCVNALKDKLMTQDEAIKYYWTSYINKLKTESKRKYYEEVWDEEDEELEEELMNIADTPYNDIPDKIYSIIIPAVYEEYGDRLGYIWEQYTCYGKSPKELKAMGYDDVDNYVAFTRKVKRFILNRLLPNNPILKELVKNRK